jgi:O-acetyl-ADP-ribose deacetylase (regulator of RNase III)
MKQKIGNIWKLAGDLGIVVITTNGFVKKNGACVMGKGIAAQAKQRFPDLEFKLGFYILKYGNRPFILGHNVVSFPVKPVGRLHCGFDIMVVSHMRGKFRPEDTVPGWACTADPIIITNSCRNLVQMADKFGWKEIYMPRPGCGAGELKWDDIRPILLTELLDDRFIVCTYL